MKDLEKAKENFRKAIALTSSLPEKQLLEEKMGRCLN
ncbi:MAG: hypothetical protein J0I32_21610 [Sphingobacteriales bacterium]|nr:hypothetical protein [Sphingobacteriales bacterium]